MPIKTVYLLSLFCKSCMLDPLYNVTQLHKLFYGMQVALSISLSAISVCDGACFSLCSESVLQPRWQTTNLQGQLWEGVYGLDWEVLQDTSSRLPPAKWSPKLHEICESMLEPICVWLILSWLGGEVTGPEFWFEEVSLFIWKAYSVQTNVE